MKAPRHVPLGMREQSCGPVGIQAENVAGGIDLLERVIGSRRKDRVELEALSKKRSPFSDGGTLLDEGAKEDIAERVRLLLEPDEIVGTHVGHHDGNRKAEAPPAFW